MSSPDPALPSDGTPVDAPPVVLPVKPPSAANPLNPQLLGNVAVLSMAGLAAVAMVGMLTLAVLYDGAYTSAAFELCRDVILLAVGGTGVTGLAHTIVQRNRSQP